MLRVGSAKVTTLVSTAVDAVIAATSTQSSEATTSAARGRMQHMDVTLASSDYDIDCSTLDSTVKFLSVIVTQTTGVSVNLTFNNVPEDLMVEVWGKYWTSGGTFTIKYGAISIVTGTNNLTRIHRDLEYHATSGIMYYQQGIGSEAT